MTDLPHIREMMGVSGPSTISKTPAVQAHRTKYWEVISQYRRNGDLERSPFWTRSSPKFVVAHLIPVISQLLPEDRPDCTISGLVQILSFHYFLIVWFIVLARDISFNLWDSILLYAAQHWWHILNFLYAKNLIRLSTPRKCRHLLNRPTVPLRRPYRLSDDMKGLMIEQPNRK